MKRKRTILVVEDETCVAEMLRRSLEALGNDCLTAHDAAAASRILDRQSVDGVTLDLSMPGRPGLDWLEDMAVRRPQLARTTLVITGGHLDGELVERLARCGAGVLSKPFTMEALRDAVRTQIARPVRVRPD